jgi:WhiB family redox-sensing transcriptional regulator
MTRPPDWRQRARCARPGVDPDLFYSDRRGDLAAAKRLCARCPVRQPCLEDALAAPALYDDGIRAGTTALDRRKLRGRVR